MLDSLRIGGLRSWGMQCGPGKDDDLITVLYAERTIFIALLEMLNITPLCGSIQGLNLIVG